MYTLQIYSIFCAILGHTHLFLHCQFDLESLRVRFCPDETGVNEMHLVQTFEFLETETQQLAGFQTARDPARGGL